MIHLFPCTDPLVQYFDRVVDIVVTAYPETINVKSSRLNVIISREKSYAKYVHKQITLTSAEIEVVLT